MNPLSRGRYQVRLARTGAEVDAAQRLRHVAFRAARGRALQDGRDADAFDAVAQHMLVQDRATGDLVACYRVQLFDGATVGQSYAAQFYDLSRLAHFPGPMLELGRFCLDPAQHDPDILRLAWAAMTRMVDEMGVGLLFGCSSFSGADPVVHAAALGALIPRIAPDQWRPAPLAPERIALAELPLAAAGQGAPMPPLLRTYLSMGGWVSDHAVIDRDMDTLHVLTGVEIAAIPPARARALRLIAAG
ncbi:GNAT family N-acetyltransferase [Pseudotabrizicola alkalilacus]|uniref:L-ornithine N(alpha)-acyltransferase n=1 Tax=Pseudotabrizicola alkalilacus TaxID=2305252 RepID=A0A411YYY9_9RHOB|nr:GNAT family N-acetyltransferase [Pseudotabrizicola alkalilacus]RGP36027.1 GNAT family N-acetyltransferase [Pseudotabrizicola alkalilacus]